MRALMLLVVLTSIAVPANVGSGECTAADSWIGGCSNTGSEIIIDGSQETNPSPGTDPVGDWNPPADWTPPPGWTPPAPGEDPFTACLDAWDSGRLCFLPAEDGEEPDEEQAEEAGIPPITITDLARFAPDGSVIIGEPDNVGIAGLPANFVASASAHTVTGELFGFPLSVRFTPAGYDFDYGDGTTSTTTSGGESWESLDQAQFTPTDTSHTYAERGTYTAHVDVRYTAEIDLGTGWFAIAGEVTSAGPPQEIRIFEAHTALVAHTCQQAPDSPGC